ncbi:hypothetical protein ACFE04_019685 [Oxalis oulophora]
MAGPTAKEPGITPFPTTEKKLLPTRKTSYRHCVSQGNWQPESVVGVSLPFPFIDNESVPSSRLVLPCYWRSSPANGSPCPSCCCAGFPARNPTTAIIPSLERKNKSITGLLADLAMAIRSTSTNIDIGNVITSTTASMGIAEKWN